MRPDWDEHFLSIAESCALMGTCVRRQVGAVVVDARRRILSTGFNGTPPKWPHCGRKSGEVLCPGFNAASGKGLDACYANHAEINALINCPDVDAARVCYSTASPCISCVKALLCTNISRVVFIDHYTQPEAMHLWIRYASPLGDPRTWEWFTRRDPETGIDGEVFRTIVLASSAK